MIVTYFQNADSGMTKAQYYEMCEMLGSEPIASEIPVEINDFPELVQTAFTLYYMLRDIWDPMGGNYLGKDYSIVFNLFDLYNIDPQDRLLAMGLLQFVDSVRSKTIAEKIKNRTPTTR